MARSILFRPFIKVYFSNSESAHTFLTANISENDEIPSESTKNLTKTGIPSANASQKTTSTGSKESVEDVNVSNTHVANIYYQFH